MVLDRDGNDSKEWGGCDHERNGGDKASAGGDMVLVTFWW